MARVATASRGSTVARATARTSERPSRRPAAVLPGGALAGPETCLQQLQVAQNLQLVHVYSLRHGQAGPTGTRAVPVHECRQRHRTGPSTTAGRLGRFPRAHNLKLAAGGAADALREVTQGWKSLQPARRPAPAPHSSNGRRSRSDQDSDARAHRPSVAPHRDRRSDSCSCSAAAVTPVSSPSRPRRLSRPQRSGVHTFLSNALPGTPSPSRRAAPRPLPLRLPRGPRRAGTPRNPASSPARPSAAAARAPTGPAAGGPPCAPTAARRSGCSCGGAAGSCRASPPP